MSDRYSGIANASIFMVKERKRRKKQASAKVDRKRQEARAVSRGFYDSQEWKELRYKVLTAHGARCQCCGSTRKDGVQIHVDHIKPRVFHPELALEFTNMQVLCGPCNEGKGSRDSTDWR